jgi:hypothetical protein
VEILEVGEVPHRCRGAAMTAGVVP